MAGFCRDQVRWEKRRPELRHKPPPTPPSELVYAIRVDVSGLRPWEYRAMEADEYEMVLHLQGLFRTEMKRARNPDEGRKGGGSR